MSWKSFDVRDHVDKGTSMRYANIKIKTESISSTNNHLFWKFLKVDAGLAKNMSAIYKHKFLEVFNEGKRKSWFKTVTCAKKCSPVNFYKIA